MRKEENYFKLNRAVFGKVIQKQSEAHGESEKTSVISQICLSTIYFFPQASKL